MSSFGGAFGWSIKVEFSIVHEGENHYTPYGARADRAEFQHIVATYLFSSVERLVLWIRLLRM